MDLEFELCQRERLPVVFLRIAVEELERIAPERAQQDALLERARRHPALVSADGRFLRRARRPAILVLLPRTSTEAAELMCRLLIEAARKMLLPGAKTPVRASLSIGLAEAQPDLDLHFETLTKVAYEGVMVASASGSECFVHTQLYGLYQRKLEREKPRKPREAAPAASAAKSAAPVAIAATAATSGPTLPAAAGVLLRTPGLDFDAFDAEVRAEFARVVAAHSTASSAPNASNDIGSWLVEIEERLLDLARAFAQSAQERALAVEREKHDQEMQLLQRRITKLARALEETEEELRHVANLKSIDRGVESAYRFVQGLSADEEGYDRKLGLLAQIVEANLALQKNLLHSKSA